VRGRPLSFKLIDEFRHSDTQHLAIFIDERDEILENLEIAETRYISSFRLTTPDPSIIDYQPPAQDPARPYISRPLPLATGSRVRSCPSVQNPPLICT